MPKDSAIRMHRTRARRELGLCLEKVAVDIDTVPRLVELGLITEEELNDPLERELALGRLLDELAEM